MSDILAGLDRGRLRSAHATLAEAIAEARAAAAGDGRARTVWHLERAEAHGFVLPERFVVGLAATRFPPVGGQPVYRLRPQRRARRAAR